MTHPYTRLFVLPAPPDADNDVTEGYEVGDVVHVTGGSVYDCRDAATGAAVWEERTGGGGGGSGDVVGPASSVDDRIATFDGTTGKLLQDSGATVASLGAAAQILAAATETVLDIADLFGFRQTASGLLKRIVWGDVLDSIENSFGGTFADAPTFAAHTHNATDTPKLLQANTHQTPDTDAGTSSLHHTIGAGAFQAAAGTRGVTNGDTHNHVGGDGAQIDFTGLSNLPIAETNANDIFRVDNPGGASAFAGTIATLPGGATLTYNITSGQESALVPASTSQLAKMRIYNTTRGTSALISNCIAGTNTITLTANVPAGWVVSDVITIASQTVSGGGISWVDLEITSVLTGKANIFLYAIINSATVGDTLRLHPFDATLSSSKYITSTALATNQGTFVFGLYKAISNMIAVSWTGTPGNIIIREAGYLH